MYNDVMLPSTSKKLPLPLSPMESSPSLASSLTPDPATTTSSSSPETSSTEVQNPQTPITLTNQASKEMDGFSLLVVLFSNY